MLLSVLGGCIREELPIDKPAINLEDPEYPSDGQAVIKVRFSLPGGLQTKTMADKPNITNIRVLIFGSSGYLKESLDAEELQSAHENGPTVTNYSFTIHPSLSDSKNLRVHVIANFDKIIPWDYEETVMNHEAYTEGGDEAYWCRFILPLGITLKKSYNNETQRMEYEYIQQGNKKYFLVTDDVTAQFTNLPLTRNFAKITVESTTPQLVLDQSETMAIINTPDRGSVAPYNTDSLRFISPYDTLSYGHLKQIYNGFSPQGMRLTNSSPDNVPFVTCYKDEDTGEIRGGAYMYERSKPGGGPNGAPSYLIVHGTYFPLKEGKTKTDLANHLANPTDYPENPVDLTNGIEGYYKIDFTDEDGYYAIFRNFRYHIRITSVSKAGASTPAAAGSTGGTGDISTNASAASLTDISDGYGRIAVSFTEMTYVEAKADIELKYKFIPNVDSGDEDINNYLASETIPGSSPSANGPVTITINAATGTQVVSSTLDGSIPSGGTDITSANGTVRAEGLVQDAEGYRTIHLSINAPTSAKSEQTITITGRIDEYKTISREVKLILMERQTMAVSCEADVQSDYYAVNYVEKKAGEGVNVKIKIPVGLPESMFPLVFDLESDKLSITPNTTKYPDDNMPVESGKSICDGTQSNKPSFHYKKTVSYDEYEALATNSDNTRTIVCHFKTNKADSACKVYVSNQYFSKAYAEFKNYTMYSFQNLAFSNYSAGVNTNFNCTFDLDDDDPKGTNTNARQIIVTLVGCNPQSVGGTSGWSGGTDNVYVYDAKRQTSVTLALKTLSSYNNNDVFYKVTISAMDDVDGNRVMVYHETAIASRPQNFTVSPTSVEMHIGESKLLTATITPENTQYTNITWSSSNTNVATVTDGRVYAVGNGNATITAQIQNTQIKATCAVTVTAVPVTGVVLDKNSIRVGVNKTYTLHATVTPSNAANKTVTWTSDDTSVATVSSSGVVTGKAYGTTVVTATTADGGYTAVCTVEVVPTPVESVSLDKNSMTLRIVNGVGTTGQLNATVLPNDAVNKNVTWSSSNPSVATVSSSGLVTAVARGTAIITVTTEDGGYKATCTVSVKQPRTETITTSNSNLSTGAQSLTQGAVTLDFSSIYGTGNNYIRPNRNNNTITITASGNEVVDVTINFTGGGYTHNYTISSGGGTRNLSGTTWTWTGETTSLVLSSTSRDARISSFVVTYLE